MKSMTVALAMAGALLTAGPPAGAQSTAAEPSVPQQTAPAAPAAPRLQRPHGADNATFGSKMVDLYTNYGRLLVDPGLQGPHRETTLSAVMCLKGVLSALTAYNTNEVLQTMSRADRRRVKAGDAAALTALSIGIIARVDGADADAIRADEALGPGVYHDAIDGLRFALTQCQLYGVRP